MTKEEGGRHTPFADQSAMTTKVGAAARDPVHHGTRILQERVHGPVLLGLQVDTHVGAELGRISNIGEYRQPRIFVVQRTLGIDVGKLYCAARE